MPAFAVAPPAAAPSLLGLALEGRAVLEWASHFALKPWLERGERGDGHPVLVLPGLLTNDWAMAPMRDFLTQAGFTPYPWEQGVNVGPRARVLATLEKRVRALARRHGEPVSVVGWSMGGAMAMALAARLPDKIRCVITLGSPLSGRREHSSISSVYERLSGLAIDDPQLQALAKGHPQVPTTSLVSKGDGVVCWESGVLEGSRKHETVLIKTASHLGLPVHPVALWVVADRLAQRPTRWRRFSPSPGVLASLAQPYVTPTAPVRARRKR